MKQDSGADLKAQDKEQFDRCGYVTIEFNGFRQVLHRLYWTVYFLMQPPWLRKARLISQRMKINFRIQETKLINEGYEALELGYHRAQNLLPSIVDILKEQLQVKLFGETAKFDHADFAAWMNLEEFLKINHWESYLFQLHDPILKNCKTKKQSLAIENWIEDLAITATFLKQVKSELNFMVGHNCQVEHAHIKSWQKRGYKAQWWHIDRGEVSAIATLFGQERTEYVLQDPAPYPNLAPGFDAFVFPDQINQTIHQVDPDQVLICGGRQRKENDQSYLWHRAPISKTERIVLVIKTFRS